MKNSHKILIVFPFSLEAMPLIEKFSAEKVAQDLWETPELVFAASGQGSLRTTALTTHLLTIYSSIEKAIMVGSAGALHQKCPEWIWVEKTKEADFNPIRDWDGYLPNPTKAVSGSMLSINQNIDQAEHRQKWRNLSQCDAVCWESAGFTMACTILGVPHAELRYITDWETIPDFKTFKKAVQAKAKSLPDLLEPFFANI